MVVEAKGNLTIRRASLGVDPLQKAVTPSSRNVRTAQSAIPR
jgi:hypothetical protein